MKNKLLYLAMFAAGASIGSAVTWLYTKQMCEKYIQDEVDSVKEYFSKEVERLNNKKDNEDFFDDEDESEDEDNEENFTDLLDEYEDVVQSTDYSKYSSLDKKEQDEEVNPVYDIKPCVIEPEECGEIESYEVISLTYYADKVLTDDQDNVIEDIEGTIGSYSLTTFGQYEDDSVFVKNDEKKCYYEILIDLRNYKDVVANEDRYLRGI